MENESIFWSIYRRLTRFEQDSIKNDRRTDCSYMDMVYMNLILFNENCTPTMISEMLGVAKSAVTVRLNRLESEGYIARTVNEKDRRSYVLTLTKKASCVYGPIDNLFREFEKNLRSEFNEEELELGRRMLRCAIKN